MYLNYRNRPTWATHALSSEEDSVVTRSRPDEWSSIHANPGMQSGFGCCLIQFVTMRELGHANLRSECAVLDVLSSESGYIRNIRCGWYSVGIDAGAADDPIRVFWIGKLDTNPSSSPRRSILKIMIRLHPWRLRMTQSRLCRVDRRTLWYIFAQEISHLWLRSWVVINLDASV